MRPVSRRTGATTNPGPAWSWARASRALGTGRPAVSSPGTEPTGDVRDASPKRLKLRRAFDRYGVAGVSLLGQTILPSQITATAMVSFGAPRNAVIGWQIVSIILWGAAFGTLAALGANVLSAG